MYWQSAWTTYVAAQDYKDPNCNNAQALESNDSPAEEYSYAPTYNMYLAKQAGADRFPINCVNFYQAVAYCWWDGGKRLATEAEYQYEITGRGRSYTYPWGNSPDPKDCTLAIWRGADGGQANNYDGCQFPKPVGSAPNGASYDGVLDMQGSVEEWIWNRPNNEYPSQWPTDWAGPNEDAGVDEPRTARGGSFFTTAPNMDGRLYDNFGMPSTTRYADLGIRCVKSRL
jgi:formylglycine-generating enzyme required for sulfatase activity